jgi:hypothetical protein
MFGPSVRRLWSLVLMEFADRAHKDYALVSALTSLDLPEPPLAITSSTAHTGKLSGAFPTP